MGNRLSRIYTKTGDDGTTGLGDGTRVAKDSARVAAFGTVDEANSAIGVLLAVVVPETVGAQLVAIQHQLFDLGGELCIPGHAAIDDADVERLEQWLDAHNAGLPALKDFILPGGGEAAARCHLARTSVRRAERETVD
jgi:cob(I)alamin adenosyltransferase